MLTTGAEPNQRVISSSGLENDEEKNDDAKLQADDRGPELENTLDEIIDETHQNRMPISQAALVGDIKQILDGFKRGRSAPINIATEEFAASISETIKADKPELRDYDVLGFIKRLTSEDKDIEALMLELTNRCDRPQPEATL